MSSKAELLKQLRIDRAATGGTGRSRVRRFLVPVLLLLSAAGGGIAFLLSPRAVPVREVTVEDAAANPSVLDASGYVVARRAATVAAKITGKVVSVLIEEGQQVEKDQVVARLDDTNAAAALRQAEAQRAQARANLDAAEAALDDARPIHERNRMLLEKGWLSRDAFDNSKRSFDTALHNSRVAQRGLTVAEAALGVARRNLDDTIVRAPFSGIVTVKAAQPGEIISPISAGGGFTRTGIGTIVDMDSLEAEIDVNENFINRITPGQSATVRLNAYPDEAIAGEVITIIPTADRTKATVKVRVGFREKNPRILPEMGARVSFLRRSAPDPAQSFVPAGAVEPGSAGDTGFVYVIRGDRVERREIRLGPATAEGRTVLSGLSPGEHLAVGDLARLHDQARIRIEQGEP